MSKYNRPINRDYFKLKKDPNALKGDKFMKCCGSEKDHDILNVKKKYDWELIEKYIEDHLFVSTVCGQSNLHIYRMLIEFSPNFS